MTTVIEKCNRRVISRNGNVKSPSRSVNLISLDSFLRGYVKIIRDNYNNLQSIPELNGEIIREIRTPIKPKYH